MDSFGTLSWTKIIVKTTNLDILTSYYIPMVYSKNFFPKEDSLIGGEGSIPLFFIFST
jgi:hypothetical protein